MSETKRILTIFLALLFFFPILGLYSCAKSCADCGLEVSGDWPIENILRFQPDRYVIRAAPGSDFASLVDWSIFRGLGKESGKEEIEGALGSPQLIFRSLEPNAKIFEFQELDSVKLQVLKTTSSSEGKVHVFWSLRAVPGEEELDSRIHPTIMAYAKRWSRGGKISISLYSAEGTTWAGLEARSGRLEAIRCCAIKGFN